MKTSLEGACCWYVSKSKARISKIRFEDTMGGEKNQYKIFLVRRKTKVRAELTTKVRLLLKNCRKNLVFHLKINHFLFGFIIHEFNG